MLPVVFIMGPTASGKTQVAMDLVARFPCDIISVDSAMIYRHMDIGTAKPSPEELAVAPHQLIDILEPEDVWSAAAFCTAATELINKSHQSGRIPLLVGGTMMYFKSLLDGMAEGLPEATPEVRTTLQARLNARGKAGLAQYLLEIDPLCTDRIDLNNQQRVIRALEVFLTTGKSITTFWDAQEAAVHPWPIIQIALNPGDRAQLHQRIEQRFRKMMTEGFEHEVVQLRKNPRLHADLPAIRSVGYRQMWEYLDGQYNYEAMIERGIIATRQLAKKQLTWLRRWPDIQWFDSMDPDLTDSVCRFLTENKKWLQ